MHIHRLLALAIVPVLVTTAPLAGVAAQTTVVAQAAQPTPDQVKAAVKTALQSVGLSFHQKREIKSMVDNYKAQTANADPATKQADAKALLNNIYNQLTPAQQTQFKASIKQSLSMDVGGT